MNQSYGKAIPRETLGLAGEFAVASELCKRGIYAQLTLGNRKRTDLLVDNGTALLRVEVKSKQGKEWPGVKGINSEDSMIVFVDFFQKAVEERPNFFILTFKDWKAFARKKVRESPVGTVVLTKDFTHIWNNGNYTGVGVTPPQIAKHSEAWTKFDPPQVPGTGVLADIKA
jgi:hypothetical protein